MTKNSTESAARPDGPRLLTVQQVAKLINCSSRHVRRLADRGAIPHPVRIGALVRWDSAARMQSA
jgi:excisionase family DNA binding protein